VDPGAGLSFRDRAAPTMAAIEQGDFDPQGINSTTFAGTPGMEAANAGVVPTPRPRPDDAGSPVGAPDDDEEETARSGVAAAGAPSGAPVMAFAPEGQPGAYRGLPDAIRRPSGEEPGFGLGLLSRNAQTGLLAAGLGMLSSRSPFLGNVVGEGGQQGLAAYGAANEADRKAALEAEKLSREAQKLQFDQSMEGRKQTETERHNREAEKTTRMNLDRSKYIPAGQYMGDDGIYRPVVLNQATGKMIDPVSGKDIDPGAKIVGKNDSGFTDDDAEKLARRFVRSGDRTVLQGLGPAAKIKTQRAVDKVMESEKVTPEEMAQRTVEFEGRKAGSRTLGTMESKMGAAAIEAEGAIKLARGVIERLPRTSFLPFNRLLQGYSANTLNPDQAELFARATAIANTYSAVMSRGANVTTDSARHHAHELLNTASDPATFNRVLDTMLNEIDMAKQSPAKMQQFYREHYGPKAVEQGEGSAGSPPLATAPPPPAQREVGKVYDTPKGKLKWNGSGWVQP
jgi:hypothetical protein